MNAYAFIFVFICKAAGTETADEYYYDVGTVLFSPADTTKTRWSVDEVLVLRAREYFLEIIPPPTVFNSINEHFANSMLCYFKDSFREVRSQSPDVEISKLLTVALLDTIGGYMKMWLLPVVKYSYYGGTISERDALELFQFHEDIKDYLHTDGSGWHNPNFHFMNAIAVNVAPLPEVYIRSYPDPCETLAYFEKTGTGLSIPIPNINWNKGAESMFVPLKNHSLVSLNSPNASNTLFTYYKIARACIQSSNLEDQDLFEERIQKWLITDVLPHLNDERLYPALKSILTLVNKSRNLCDSVLDSYSEEKKSRQKNTFIGIPIDLSSKKMMVITIIIILEIVWCVPTLCYLMCAKIKKRNSKTHMCFFVEPKHRYVKRQFYTESTQCSPQTANSGCYVKITNKDVMVGGKYSTKSVRLGHSPQTRSCTIVTNSSLNCNSSKGGDTLVSSACQNSSMIAICADSNRLLLKKVTNSAKSIQAYSYHSQSGIYSRDSSNHEVNSVNDRDTASKTESFMTVKELQPNKTISMLHENNNSLNISESAELNNESSLMSVKDIKVDECACTSSLEYSKQSSVSEQDTKEVVVKSNKKLPRFRMFDMSKSKGLKLSTNNQVLEITIDRPQTEICVDISSPIRIVKPSKIPKRFFTNSLTQTSCSTVKKVDTSRKSLIPQPVKHVTVDDIYIDKKPSKDIKLNVTL